MITDAEILCVCAGKVRHDGYHWFIRCPKDWCQRTRELTTFYLMGLGLNTSEARRALQLLRIDEPKFGPIALGGK